MAITNSLTALAINRSRLVLPAFLCKKSFSKVGRPAIFFLSVSLGSAAIGMTDPVKALVDLRQRIEKQSAVAVVFKDGFAFVSAGCDVIERSVVFNS